MKSHAFALLFSGLLLAGCATVESRIGKHQTAFNSWPADVQQKVRAGKVDIGFTREMVTVALGAPDRLSSRTTAQGVSDVWIYFDKGPKFSLGIGMGSAGRHSAVGGGVVVGDDGWRDEEVMRVIFVGDRVTAIETRK